MLEPERLGRERVVAVARSFTGTPYADAGRVKGPRGGVDCGTILAMVFEEAGLEFAIDIPAYSPQWYLHHDEEQYLNIILRYATEIDEGRALPGDLVVYKFGRLFAHGGIIVDPGFPAIVHAYKDFGIVLVDNGLKASLTHLKTGKPRPRRFFRHKSWSV